MELIGNMRKKGLTLIELVIAMAIGGIVALAITAHFVSEYRFRSAIQDKVTLAREARIAMNHMARVLRFAKASTVNVTTDPQTGETLAINATIEGGHLSFIISDTAVAYALDAGNNLIYTVVGVGADTIATDITVFNGNWGSPPDLVINLTAQKEYQSIPLQTTIRVLAE